ncbi:MAG: AAA family ATPase [Rhabdochlamydiaceae bacterium]|nr:AAA family ATPase [Rhabdochlamydiaceae bacterium]
MPLTVSDIFDLNTVYNPEYSYSLPRQVLVGFGRGLGFPDNSTEYTEAELEALQYDVLTIWNRIKSKEIEEAKEIILTAGAPGVGKTTVMRRMWENQPNFAYICPDDVCLKEMKSTYGEMVAKDGSFQGLKSAYNKWRAASNFAHHLITAQLVRENKNFFFGTTASGDKTYLFLDFLKKRGYNIRILHVSAPDQVRFDSIAKRDNAFVQTSDQDVLNKQLMVHERIQDTFLKYASRIDFYFRPLTEKGPEQEAILAATWISQEKGPARLEIINQKAYEEMRNLHDAVCENMKKPELKWANTVDKTL